MFKKSIAAAGLAAAFMFIPTAANALDCVNVSKPPAACGANCSGPVIQGNWVWLPSVFEGSPQVWAFVPPGTVPLTSGANGNFQSGEGYALLVNAVCDSHGKILDKRQTDRGIQLLEGCSAPH